MMISWRFFTRCSFFFWVIPAFFYGASLTLINDSSYDLTAIVRGADGSFLGQIFLQPGQQKLWTSSPTRFELIEPSQPVVSVTPYTVIWKCSHQGVYSVCSNVSPGSTITANTCSGNYFCPPEPEEKKESEKSASSE